MRTRGGLVTLGVLATLALSVGLPASPAGALPAPTVTVTGTPNPGTTGSITYDVTVVGTTPTPTGSVMVADGVGGTCSIASLAAGAGNCSIVENASGSPYTVTATYSGDTNYATAMGSVSETVNQGTPTVTITGTPNPGTGGHSISYGVSVAGAGATPTGSVTVADGAGGACSISALSAGAGSCSIVENASVTPYTVIATYSGDTNYATAMGSVSETVNKGTPAVTITGNPNPGTTGGVSYDVTVAGSPTPTGSVTVADGKAGTCVITSLTAGAGSCVITELAQNSPFTVVATYSGDTNYAGTTGQVVETVNKGTPSPPIISNLPDSGAYLGSFVATVITTGDGTTFVTSSTASVCTVGPDGYTVTYVGLGTCSLTAHVAAGSNFNLGTGAAQTINIGQATPSTPVIANLPANAVEFETFAASVLTNGDGTTSVTSSSTDVCTVGPDGLTVTFVGFGVCTLTANVGQGVHYLAATGNPQSFPIGPAARGYWLVGTDGGIFSFGAAGFHGSMGSTPLQRPVVGITPSASRTGYWLVASDGGIFSFGDSSFYGSIPGLGLHPAGSGLPNSLNVPIVGMVPSSSGHGYFMVASDGGVFAFGDARFAGSCPGIGGCEGSAVSVMPDSTGKGYWLVTNIGAVYAFGDAVYYGAPARSSVPVVDAVATPAGHGYWLLYANGVVSNFGDATNFGSPLGYANSFNPATAIFPTADGKGYWVASARGDVFAYGAAPYLGSMADAGLNGEIIAAFGF